MTKTTTNLLGLLITILAGTYFFVSYCNNCDVEVDTALSEKQLITPVIYEASTNSHAFGALDFAYFTHDDFTFMYSSIKTPTSLPSKRIATIEIAMDDIKEEVTTLVEH